MRKTLLSLILFIIFCGICSLSYAIKADPTPFVYIQPDGTKITIVLHGDENFSYITTLDGTLLIKKNSFFVSATEAEKDSIFAEFNETRKIRKISAEISNAPSKTKVPHFGKIKIPVILVDFQDYHFSLQNNPDSLKMEFDEYLNREGKMTDFGHYNTRLYGSVKKYFKDMSNGAFEPDFDIYGPYTLSNDIKYYGEGHDDQPKRLIPEALDLAYTHGVDYTQYDSNKDGYVDLVAVLCAGYSQSMAGNDDKFIWPKVGNFGDIRLKDSLGNIVATFYRYQLTNELNGLENQQINWINGIGLFCHEFSHALGLPDMYVTSSAPKETQIANNQSMEYWSIMDLGCYLRNGYHPCSYTAFEKEMLGWNKIDTLFATEKTVELKPLSNGGNAYRIMNDADSTQNEYFIVENIQCTGWNRYQKGHGMIVTHVDYDDGFFSIKNNSVNFNLGHPRCTVVAADGLLANQNNYVSDINAYYEQLAGDPFPGTNGITELTDTSSVKPVVYVGEKLGKPITNIVEDATSGIITFDFCKNVVPSHISSVPDNTSTHIIYNISGQKVGRDFNILPKGVYIVNKKKVLKI